MPLITPHLVQRTFPPNSLNPAAKSTCIQITSSRANIPSILDPCPKNLKLLAKTKMADELTNLFVSLWQTAQLNVSRVPIPHHISASRDWSLSCIARVITDRMVIDDNFIRQMLSLVSPSGYPHCTHCKPNLSNRLCDS